MFRTRIGQKLLVLLLAVSLVPLGLVSLYWYHTAQVSLQASAEERQKLVTQSDVYLVNQYMTDKVNALIIHSQATSVQDFSQAAATQDLRQLLDQDGDIQQVTLARQDGVVAINLNRSGSLSTGNSIASTDAFRAATYLAGKEYISPVSYTAGKQPMVTIAVPLVQYSSAQNLQDLSTAGSSQIRTPDEIHGVLMETVTIGNLWKNVLASSAGAKGYAYVVDSEGALIGYPNASFALTHQDLRSAPPVAAFLTNPTASPTPSIMTSETGSKVLTSYGKVARTNWGVITVVPLSNIFAISNMVAIVGLFMMVAAAIIVGGISYVITRRVTTPIIDLAAGAEQLSQGNLDTQIAVTSHDEIGSLARTFNEMAASLGSMFRRAEAESIKANVILNNVNEGILALDLTGRIILANTAAAVLIGDLPHNILNQSMYDLYHWSKNGKPFRPLLTEVGIYEEILLANLHRREYYVDILVNPIKDDPTGIQCIITILDKSNERELENMKVDFVSMAAHELRTPMTAIRGYMDLIKHEASFTAPDPIQGYLEHIESSSTQLIGLINNLLNVSRIERNALTLRRDKVDWAKVVQKSVGDLRFLADTKSIHLGYEGPEDGVYIYADELAISEIINNLISNAINHTLEDGSITVVLETVDNEIITKVIDTGVGIPKKNLPYLFTKFYRARSSLTSGSGGTGLGLFISRSIAEMHDGSITVASEEGKGSTFTVKLPRFDDTRYNEEIKRRGNVTNSHGWIIKNTARRRQS